MQSNLRRPPRGASIGIRFIWLLGAWTNTAARFGWLIVVLSLGLAVIAGFYTVENIRVNTDATDMFSEELDFLQDRKRYLQAFPYHDNSIVIVVDGETADLAQDAASRLYRGLLANQDRFHSLFYPTGMEHFQRNGLLYKSVEELRDLSERMTDAQPLIGSLTRDPTLRGLFGLLGEAVERLGTDDGNPAALASGLHRISAVLEAAARGERRRLSWTALMSSDEAAENGRRQIIQVQARLDYRSLAPASATMALIRDQARGLGLTPENGVEVRLTGSAALNSEELQSVTGGASLAGIISVISVVVLLLIGLRSLWLVGSVLLTLFVGLVWTAAFATFAVGELNMISVAFAVLFIGLGVDFGIHYALRYREDVTKGMATRGALREAARSVGGSLAFSALAAAVAFLSFTPTSYRGVSELGIIAAAGMAIALFVSLTLLPALLAIWPVRVKDLALPAAERPGPDALSVQVEHFLQRHGRAVCIGALVLLFASAVLVPDMRFDRNTLNLKDPHAESVRTALDLAEDREIGFDSIQVVAPNRERLRELSEQLSALPEVEKVVTIFNFVPENQDEKLEIIDELSLLMTPVLATAETEPPPTEMEQISAMRDLRRGIQATLAANRAGDLREPLERLSGAIGEFLAARGRGEASLDQLEADLLGGFEGRMAALAETLHAEHVTIESLPPALRVREVAPDGRYRMSVYPAVDMENEDAHRRFVEAVSAVAPNVTGSPVIELESGDAVVNAFAMASTIAAVAITLLLAVLLRRLLDVLLVLSPLVLAGLLTIAIAVLVGLPLNFANIIVLPLLLGLGVASGIHLVMRARREHSQEFLATSTPRAVLFSALTTVASFGSLAVSPHQGTASMGELLFIAISMTLLCVLIVLPAMMAVFVKPEKL